MLAIATRWSRKHSWSWPQSDGFHTSRCVMVVDGAVMLSKKGKLRVRIHLSCFPATCFPHCMHHTEAVSQVIEKHLSSVASTKAGKATTGVILTSTLPIPIHDIHGHDSWARTVTDWQLSFVFNGCFPMVALSNRTISVAGIFSCKTGFLAEILPCLTSASPPSPCVDESFQQF